MARKASPIATRRVAGLFESTADGGESDLQTVPEDVAPEPAEVAEPEPKPVRIKRTFHIDRDAAILLQDLQTKRFRDFDHKPELSELVSEAIRLLGKSEQLEAQTS